MKYLQIIDNQYIRLDFIDEFIIMPDYQYDLYHVIAQNISHEIKWIVEILKTQSEAEKYLRNLMIKIQGAQNE